MRDLALLLISGFLSFIIARFFIYGQTDNKIDPTTGSQVIRTHSAVVSDEIGQGCGCFAIVFFVLTLTLYFIAGSLDLI